MKQGEKVAALLAGILFTVSVVWSLISGDPEGEGPLSDKSDTYSSDAVDAVSTPAFAESIEWGQPSPQGGANWIFDLFTPPVIYYDKETETFTVTPPFPDADSVEEPFALELVEISRVPFRFQLVSYAGARGNYLLTLENLKTGRDVFASPGETLAEFDIRIDGFNEMRAVAASSREGTTEAFDLVGEAIVIDQRSGKQYTLHHNHVTYLEAPVAEFLTDSGDTIHLSAGESWSSPGVTYTVKTVDASAQTATVEKTSTDVSDKVVKILHTALSFNSSDLSNRKTRQSDPSPGTF